MKKDLIESIKSAVVNLENNFNDDKKSPENFINIEAGYAEAVIKNMIFDIENNIIKIDNTEKKNDLLNYLKITLVESEKLTKKIYNPTIKASYKLGVIKTALGMIWYGDVMRKEKNFLKKILKEERSINEEDLNKFTTLDNTI